jgi:serine/threonine protein kinase
VPSTAPQIIGRYSIHEEIASGGMASVHFARLIGASPGAPTLAAKRAHPHLVRDDDFALMFLDEARLASRIRHPNVVATIDVLQTEGDLLLVMEYVHGESLWRLARAAHERGERVPLGVAGSIVVDALRGLHAAHEACDERGAPLNLVHRDVSPHNVLVGVDGVARLVDFGIAKAEGRLHATRDSSVKGKYAYMAPEQARGEAVSRLSDTYAAAIVFWELLTGERLFAGRTEAETVHKCLVARIRRPSLLVREVGPELDAILERGLSRDPQGRYATAEEMAADIEACVAIAPRSEVGEWLRRIAGPSLVHRERIMASLEQSPEPAGASTARSRAMWVGGIAAVLGVVSAVTLVARRGTPSTPAPTTMVAAAPSAVLASSASAPPMTSSDPAPSPASSPMSVATTSVAVASATSVARPPKIHAAGRAGRAGRSTSCDPPYSIDSAGRQIFKPECVR